MQAASLLAKNPNPTNAQIDDSMSGNICRCGTYQQIREAIHRAARLGGAPAQSGGAAVLEPAPPAEEVMTGGAE
jgi:xanthine dehydrogenase iron-sulfur cluster and FAD-binding subunit A